MGGGVGVGGLDGWAQSDKEAWRKTRGDKEGEEGKGKLIFQRRRAPVATAVRAGMGQRAGGQTHLGGARASSPARLSRSETVRRCSLAFVPGVSSPLGLAARTRRRPEPAESGVGRET